MSATAKALAAVKERPILFSAPMVRALLAGTKTQTRRAVRPQPIQRDKDFASWPVLPTEKGWKWTTTRDSAIPEVLAKHCPYGHLPGDRLWVKETHGLYQVGKEWRVAYRADGENASIERWKPSIFMRRTASRTTLELTQVRVERLKEISDEDAIAEGIEPGQWKGAPVWGPPARNYRNPVAAYADLWESINGAGSWDANPWVWALTFRRLP